MEHVAQGLQEQENVIVTQDGLIHPQAHQQTSINVMLVILVSGGTIANVFFFSFAFKIKIKINKRFLGM